jgi:hypothetical protein
MNPKAELAEFVMDHLGQNANMATAALGSAVVGLARILIAYEDAQQRRGNWGGMLDNLRSGVQMLEPALPLLRQHGGPGAAALIEMGEREVRFARLVDDEIVRLTAGESTAQ